MHVPDDVLLQFGLSQYISKEVKCIERQLKWGIVNYFYDAQ